MPYLAENWNKCSTFVTKLHIIMYTNRKKITEKLFRLVFPLVVLVTFLTSCMSDTEYETTASNKCYISKVSFNSFRKKLSIKASDGVTDSTYYSTYSASNWIFTIDNKALFIENRDSLPCNTDLSRVVMNLSYVGGVAYYKSSDAWDDDPWVSYNSEDSIDLRKPLFIKVIATDNTERKYTLRINVHTQEGDSLHWNTVETSSAISGEYPMKAIAWEEQMGVLTNNGGALLWSAHDNANSGAWSEQVTNLPLTTDVYSLTKNSQSLFVNTTDGEIYSSTDGTSWSLLSQKQGHRLIGISNSKIYVLDGQNIQSTLLNNISWSGESFDDSESLLPSQEIAFLTYQQNSDLTRMIFLGNRSEVSDTTAVVWSKCWTDFEKEENESWMHYTRSWVNTSQLPRFSQMNLMYYDNMLMMMAGESLDGSISALERIYYSQDNGLTWWRLQSILPPADLKGTDGYLTAAVDVDNFIWVIAGGKAYRGCINRLGFIRQDIY